MNRVFQPLLENLGDTRVYKSRRSSCSEQVRSKFGRYSIISSRFENLLVGAAPMETL